MGIGQKVAAWLAPGRAVARAEEAKSWAPAAGTLLLAGGGAGEESWRERSYEALARGGFMRNPVVHRCVAMIAEAASSAPPLLYRGAEEVARHPILALLRHPNPTEDGAGFLQTLCGHLLLSGNAFVQAARPNGRDEALHLLRPDRVRVIAAADGWPEGYEYRAGRRVLRLPAEEPGGGRGPVLHVRLFHPLDDGAGLSPLVAAQGALDLHNAAARWNTALLENSARPSGALVFKPAEGGNLSPEQFDRLKRELEAGYSGAARAGRPMLLEGGLDWKAMALSPRDMDFMEAKNGAARDIALAFGVPPMLLGIPGDATYSNFQEANRAFHRQTVVPLMRRLAAALGGWLAERAGEPELRLAFDEDRLDGLAAERDALWSRVGAADFLSEDEKREAVGYGPRQAA